MTINLEALESAYLASGGVRCPCCAASDIQADELEPAGLTAYGNVRCRACGAAWVDVYRLAGISDLDAPVLVSSGDGPREAVAP